MIVPPRVLLARLLDQCARHCARWSERLEHGATLLYRANSRVQAIKAARECERRRLEAQRTQHQRDALVIDDLLADVARGQRARN
jgi:hypothetical protein